MDELTRQDEQNEYEIALYHLRKSIRWDLQDIADDKRHNEISKDECDLKRTHVHEKYEQLHQELKDKYNIKDES